MYSIYIYIYKVYQIIFFIFHISLFRGNDLRFPIFFISKIFPDKKETDFTSAYLCFNRTNKILISFVLSDCSAHSNTEIFQQIYITCFKRIFKTVFGNFFKSLSILKIKIIIIIII